MIFIIIFLSYDAEPAERPVMAFVAAVLYAAVLAHACFCLFTANGFYGQSEVFGVPAAAIAFFHC